ncbi:MAG: response regulator [Candidatus Riflebacteria bacterium]|nr:response regulator [Candidatus Riflebacteria bacterium]
MGKKRIFIVEDEGIVALEIKVELEDLGYVADVFSSGEEVIANIENTDTPIPNLILMDIRLPGKFDGTETAEYILKAHDIPVIYVTAHTDEVTVQKAVTTRPYSYMVKPFSMKELGIAVDIALYKHKTEREKEQLTRKLAEARAEVKQLTGFLPICSYCKKIRDDKECWQQLETYISKHSDAVFSHGICPDCYKKQLEEECGDVSDEQPNR